MVFDGPPWYLMVDPGSSWLKVRYHETVTDVTDEFQMTMVICNSTMVDHGHP